MIQGQRVRELLESAYEPCSEFCGLCRGIMKWKPENGHIPRGFCGAKGSTDEVELVLVCAEPGDPHDHESHQGVNSLDYLDSAVSYAYRCFETGKDPFHRNIRYILDLCFPEEDFAQQMRRTWITDSVKCSAPIECGAVPAEVGRACRAKFLEKELAFFPNALVVALGKKAATRLKGFPGILEVAAAAPPFGTRKEAKTSWDAIQTELLKRRSVGAKSL